MTFSITALAVMTFRITKLSIMMFRIAIRNATLSIMLMKSVLMLSTIYVECHN